MKEKVYIKAECLECNGTGKTIEDKIEGPAPDGLSIIVREKKKKCLECEGKGYYITRFFFFRAELK